MKNNTQYTEWTLIDWDGNKDLNYKCWRKSFSSGHVSIGEGKFTAIIHSFGANSDRSFSSTRWRNNVLISEEQAKEEIDKTY